MTDICAGDNRFEIINRAKRHLLEATNIDTSPDEMEVLDTFLFRCWQMGWLEKYDYREPEGKPLSLDEDKFTYDTQTQLLHKKAEKIEEK